MAKLKRILPWVALIAALLAAILILIGIPQRQQMLTDTGVTRPAVEAALAQLQAIHPASIDDPAFHRAIEALAGKDYIVSTWLFAPDGRIVYSTYMVPKDGTAAEHATAETQRLLDTIPASALTAEQRTLLLAASAIQSEGEHNDVYRHRMQVIRTTDGTLLGWLGVAYEVSPTIGGFDWHWVLSILGWLACLGVYWLALPGWVWLDARERGEKAGVWALFVLIGNLVALLAYLLARAPRKVAGLKGI